MVLPDREEILNDVTKTEADVPASYKDIPETCWDDNSIIYLQFSCEQSTTYEDV